MQATWALYVVLLGTPLQGSLKVPHKPFGEGGLPWQVSKPNPGVMIFNECLGIVEVFDNDVVSFRYVVPRF
jgi:hypothetical protein